MAVQRKRPRFQIGDMIVKPGSSHVGELPLVKLVTGTDVSLPLRVFHGVQDGPTVWVSAAVHGDEINGVEIIRRVSASLSAKSLAGTVIMLPIVNVHGFITGDRYLPDRRDLNRSFPGSARGSLAGRVAHLFTTEIVQPCDLGIDLHTGSDHRTNWPQIRANLDDPETLDLAEAFGAPLMLHAKLRDGSLRATALDNEAKVLLYEAGEANRFDNHSIVVGVRGVQQVLAKLGMISLGPSEEESREAPLYSRSSKWIRARKSGICSLEVGLGDHVEHKQQLAVTHDALGNVVSRLFAPKPGVVIGHTQHPLVNQGDGLIHLADISEKDIL